MGFALRLGGVAIGLLGLGLVLSGGARAAASAPAFAERGMVAATVGPAVPVGSEVLARGGNAFDAAVATALAVGCAHHFSSGIGGGGFFVFHAAASGETRALDAREVAPAAAHAGLYRATDGSVNREASRAGGLAVAVPGLVQGLFEVHRLYGKLAWAEVVKPASELCRAGVPIGVYHRAILQAAAPKLARFPETRRIQLGGDRVPPLGWRLQQSDLADTYDAIARHGPRAMIEGPIARRMVEATRAAGGVLTEQDLRDYALRWREPLRGSYRGVDVVSMPPPSSGGVLLLQMLNTLEPFDLRARGRNSSQTIHLMAEAMKLAFADRAVFLGDPDFFPVPTERLTSKRYGSEQAARLLPPPFWRRPPWHWGRAQVLRVERPVAPPRDDAGTTHISVMDAEGNAVALTQTVNTLFGSGITPPGTGIVLNNEMDDFAVAPGVPNAFELVGDRANAIEGGKRPLSSMTPTLAFRDGRPWLAVGSPMGPMIITAVLETLVNVIDFELDVQAAVAAPRFHHQWAPDTLWLEDDHPRDVVERLRRMGHPVEIRDFGIGAVAALSRDPKTGLFFGGSDPRRDAGAQGP
jgi:gamma-glutamyltranspeptidase/glutathione hydrolase